MVMSNLKKLLTVIYGFMSIANTSKLQIVHPSKLKQDISSWQQDKSETGTIESSLGNFGEFNYGTSLRGRVFYPETNQDGCLEFTDSHFNHDHI
jgi:hypothetical protein